MISMSIRSRTIVRRLMDAIFVTALAIGMLIVRSPLAATTHRVAPKKAAPIRNHRDFVTRRGIEFFVRGAKFRVAGVNTHYLPWGSHREVTRVLDDAVAMHANVVRTFIAPIIGSPDGSTPTIWNWKSSADSSNLGVKGVHMASWDPKTKSMAINAGPDGLQRVDFLIQQAARRRLRLIISFLDYWGYTGGSRQVNAWYGSDANDHFFAEDARAKADYKHLVQAVVTRVNGLTGVAYKDDPTIFAWELMNEPDIHPTALLLDWVEEMAAYVKSLDPNHLLASGQGSIETKLAELRGPNIDFGTWHGYPTYEHISAEAFESQIGDYCALADSYGKPVILEEFGVPRSDPLQSQTYRTWLKKIRENASCAGWLVWRLVARQDNGQYPVDDHDQFDVHNDGGAAWSALRDSALAMAFPPPAHSFAAQPGKVRRHD
jgi:mannan endo-1,4-beta-mannosidase